MSLQIFISYSHNDAQFARKLATSLSSLNAKVWIDIEDIPAGMNWSSAIQEGLNTCDVMIVILSPSSSASKNVDNEWQYFLDKDKLILPILLEETDVQYQLRRIQYIDFLHQAYNAAFKQLQTQLIAKEAEIGVATNDAEVPQKEKLLPVRGENQVRPLRRLSIGTRTGRNQYLLLGFSFALALILNIDFIRIVADIGNGLKPGEVIGWMYAPLEMVCYTQNNVQVDCSGRSAADSIPIVTPTAQGNSPAGVATLEVNAASSPNAQTVPNTLLRMGCALVGDHTPVDCQDSRNLWLFSSSNDTATPLIFYFYKIIGLSLSSMIIFFFTNIGVAVLRFSRSI